MTSRTRRNNTGNLTNDQESSSAAKPSESESISKTRTGWAGGLSRRVLHFTPSWFSVNMGTGITAILLHNLPYQFPGLRQISIAIFILNIILFVSFTLASIVRYIIWPNVFWTMMYHPQQSLFLGTFPMGLATITNMIVFVCVPAFGQRFAYLAWAIWWIDVFFSVIIAIGVPFFMFTRHDNTELKSVVPGWLLPIVAPNVASASGAIVASVLPPAQARLTLTVSYMLWSSVPIALMVMTLIFVRLAIYKVPPPEAVVSVLLPVGACGQGAFALLQMADVVHKLAYESGQWLEGGTARLTPEELRSIGNAILSGSVCCALVIWGVGIFWIVIAVMIILDTAREGAIPFNMSHWAYIFPPATHAIASVKLGSILSSGALRIFGTIESIAIALLWLYIASMTAIRGWQGSIFVAPCLAPTGGEPPAEAPSKRKL